MQPQVNLPGKTLAKVMRGATFGFCPKSRGWVPKKRVLLLDSWEIRQSPELKSHRPKLASFS